MGFSVPRYIGKGPNFHLVICELQPLPDASNQKKQQFHEEVCGSCGFFTDAFKRAQKAQAEGKAWRKLICVRPENKAVLNKWIRHLTKK